MFDNFYWKTSCYIFITINSLIFRAVASEKMDFYCEYIHEYMRKDCGYFGITPSQCADRKCCYSSTQLSGVPWCYYSNDTHYRTTTQPNYVTRPLPVSSRDLIPGWMTELLQMLPSVPNHPKKSSGNSTSRRPPNKSTFVLEIQDELNCQKTYRLYKKIHGDFHCFADYSRRISCVEQKLPKLRGESECSACVKLDCCYDPIKRVIDDRRVAPHCYKPREVSRVHTSSKISITTTTPLLVTLTKNTTLLPMTSSSRPTSKRLQSLLAMLKQGRYRTPFNSSSLGSGMQAPFGVVQNQVLSPNFASPASSFTTPANDRKRLLLTQHPTRGPGSLLGKNIPSFPLGNVFPLLSQSKKEKVKGETNSKNLTPMSLLLKYLLRKKFGITQPTTDSLKLNSPQNAATIEQPRKSGFSSLFQLNPQFYPETVVSSKFDVFSYLLKQKNYQSSGEIKKAGNSQNVVVDNILHTKVNTNPYPGRNSSYAIGQNPFKLDRWNQIFNTKPVPIKPVFEIGNMTSTQRNCFPENCGHRVTDGQAIQRIVGGQWTGGIEYWPWMASLRRTFTDDDRYIHICGATVISRKWILTAAHCFMAYKKRGEKLTGQKEKFVAVYAIHAGQYFRDDPTPFLQIHSLELFIPHPRFDFVSLVYDIAVAKLNEHIWFNNFVQPACLPGKKDLLYAEDRSWVVGWGDTFQIGEQNQSKLKELPLPLISSSDCRKNWPQHFHEAWICTEGSYLEDACAGDSGGPLVKRNDSSRWNVIGVAIAGTRECSTNVKDIKAGIYTKVAYFRDFIDFATKGNCNEDAGWKHKE